MDAKEGSNNFIIGFLIGAASTIPGISGGVVAVLFRVYERLIYDVSHLRAKLKEEFWFILTIGLGILLGLVLLMFVMKFVINEYELAAMFLFAGLILGQLPDLVRITKNNEPTKTSHLMWLYVGLAVMTILLIAEIYNGGGEIGSGSGTTILDGYGPMVGVLAAFVVGAIFASSKIVPGISGTTVLIAMGLYMWTINIVTEFQLLYLIPFTIGFVAAIFLSAKVMHHIIKKYHSALYYFIVGLTVGSLMLITILSYHRLIDGLMDIGIACAALSAGVVMSVLLSRIKRPEKT
jgi:putative membrane protein